MSAPGPLGSIYSQNAARLLGNFNPEISARPRTYSSVDDPDSISQACKEWSLALDRLFTVNRRQSRLRDPYCSVSVGHSTFRQNIIWLLVLQLSQYWQWRADC